MDVKHDGKWKVLDLIRDAILHDWDADGEIILWEDHKGKSVWEDTGAEDVEAIFEHYPYMFPSLETLKKSSGIRYRTIERAIAVLQAKDVLIINQERTDKGFKRNVYTILEPKLRYLAQQERLPLFDQAAAAYRQDSASTWPRRSPPARGSRGDKPGHQRRAAHGDEPRAPSHIDVKGRCN